MANIRGAATNQRWAEKSVCQDRKQALRCVYGWSIRPQISPHSDHKVTEARVPLRSVQRYAGHSDPQTTLRYAQAIDADEAIAAVEHLAY